MNNLKQLQKQYERKIGHRNQLSSQIKTLKTDIEVNKENTIKIEEARVIIQDVAKKTQQELQFHINEIVTLAINSIFGEKYKFNLNFIDKRGKTEADINLITETGELVKPQDATGGGVVDIVSFALRIALWSLSIPKSRKVLILDEPFRNIDKQLQPKAGEFLKEISDKLGIQIIIISHIAELTNRADRVFRVTTSNYKKWKKSKVEEV